MSAVRIRLSTDLRVFESTEGPAGYFDDAETAKEIQERVAAGSTWAWCDVEVIVSAHLEEVSGDGRGLLLSFEASDLLCSCSYEDEEDFRLSETYEDMLHEAFNVLKDQMSEHLQRAALLKNAVSL